MKKNMRWSPILACVLMLSVAGVGRAEPFDAKLVSADAKWVVHLDVEAMRLSDARRMSAFMDKNCQQWEDKGKAFFGRSAELCNACRIVDVTTDVNSLTFYGFQFERLEGVALVRGKFGAEATAALVEQMRQLPDYAASKHGTRELHSWTSGKGGSRPTCIAASCVRPGFWVVATPASAAIDALDVLDGVKPNLVGKSPLDAATPVGELFTARAAGLAEADLPSNSPLVRLALTASTLAVDAQFPANSPILKDTAMLSVTVGEVVTEIFLSTQIVVQESKDTAAVKTAVDTDLDSALYLVNDADLADMVYHVTVKPRGDSLWLDVRGPADVGWNYVDKLAKKLLAQERGRNELTPRR